MRELSTIPVADDSVFFDVFGKILALPIRGGLFKASRLPVLRASDCHQGKSLLREFTRLSTTTFHHDHYQEHHFRSGEGHLGHWRYQSDALRNSQPRQQEERAYHSQHDQQKQQEEKGYDYRHHG